MTAVMCRVPDCGYPSQYKRFQLCEAHRKQQRAGKPFAPARRRVKHTEPCSFAECDVLRSNLLWCSTHYLQQYYGRPMRLTKRPVPVLSRDENGNKWCGTCDLWRPESDFASSVGKADNLQTRCRACNARIYRENAERVRDNRREYRFGITRKQFDQMFAAQGNRCAICKTDDPGTNFWGVDHDHACCPNEKTCGECIRGILCSRCNHALGHARDRADVLRAAADYLDARARVEVAA